MLLELKVENLALIDSLHLRFDRAQGDMLVVMTGETGAGKSIMMRAIGLLSGGRGSAQWIRSGAESCTVEALFEGANDGGNGVCAASSVLSRRLSTRSTA